MASEILGLTQDQIRGKKAIDPAWCFIREDGTKVPLAEYPINRALAEEMPISGLVLGVIRPDRQSPTWVECNARKIWGPAGELEQAIVVFSDITDRKRAEEMLLLSEEKFSKAFQSSPDAFLLTSVPDGRITEVNAGAILLSGYSTEEMLGRTTTELGLWADPAARDAYMAEILREGRAANFETVFRVKSGAIITGLISGGIIQLRDGKCFLSVIRDISDRKRAEVALRQQTEELRASNDELELFNRAATGRELRMIELKQEINELCRRLGEPPRHATDQVQTDSVPGVGPVPAPPGGGGA
jgi:PAS domain S-box-containing protein